VVRSAFIRRPGEVDFPCIILTFRGNSCTAVWAVWAVIAAIVVFVFDLGKFQSKANTRVTGRRLHNGMRRRVRSPASRRFIRRLENGRLQKLWLCCTTALTVLAIVVTATVNIDALQSVSPWTPGLPSPWSLREPSLSPGRDTGPAVSFGLPLDATSGQAVYTLGISPWTVYPRLPAPSTIAALNKDLAAECLLNTAVALYTGPGLLSDFVSRPTPSNWAVDSLLNRLSTAHLNHLRDLSSVSITTPHGLAAAGDTHNMCACVKKGAASTALVVYTPPVDSSSSPKYTFTGKSGAAQL